MTNNLVPLEDIVLLPVLELEPFQFAAADRPRPAGSGLEMEEAWGRFWLDSLADSGVTGLTPLRPRSWHVPTRVLINLEILQKILAAFVNDWGGVEALSDPDSKPVLDGGLALASGGEVLVGPGCCSDLGNVAEWHKAAGYRGSDWQMLWIGHPWLSIRFDGERLVLSAPHESESPEERWSVRPEVLGTALDAAVAELVDFARRLEGVLEYLGLGDGAKMFARSMAGLAP